MSNEIVKFIGRFSDRNYQTLGPEALLFSGVFGAAYQSWIVFGTMFPGLCWMLGLAKGKIYTMVALSCLWGIIAASIAISAGGWMWSVASGLTLFSLGMMMHAKESGFFFRAKPSSATNLSMDHRWRRYNLN